MLNYFRDAEEENYPVIGLDCQWRIQNNGRSRSRVALLQLASHKGNVALIQLDEIGSMPHDLVEILRNPTIVKAGIETIRDAQYLSEDYGLNVNGTFDLRFLAEDTNHFPGGLERLSKDVLGLDIGRDWEIISSNWEQDPLEQRQVDYAGTAVRASIDIFVKLIGNISSNSAVILGYCYPRLDRRYIFRSEKWQ